MKETFWVKTFNNFRELAAFVNSEEIKRDNIVNVISKDFEIILLYYK